MNKLGNRSTGCYYWRRFFAENV